MKRRLILVPSLTVIFAGLIACVTVNVYFPAAEIKDLSRKIEEEVQKQAAQKQAGGEPNSPNTPNQAEPKPDAGKPHSEGPKHQGAGGSVEELASTREVAGGGNPVGLLDTLLGVTPAYAQDKVGTPEVTSPAIRKIIDSRAGRVEALNKYKGLAVIGENNKGLVEVLKLDGLADLKERAEAQRIVKAENADREELFREIAVAKKVDPSQIPKIRETYAGTLRDLARPGDMIQTPDGTWKKK